MTLTIFDGGLTRAASEQPTSAGAGLVSSREPLRIANVRFQAGVGTQLDVVNAIQALASADSSVITAEYNYNLALAKSQNGTTGLRGAAGESPRGASPRGACPSGGRGVGRTHGRSDPGRPPAHPDLVTDSRRLAA